ncbi:MAG: tellurite resistance TerB family protein [Verrucomicrobiia bacterium]|jgi:uncharacterized tellurite resistance protein B-like protein
MPKHELVFKLAKLVIAAAWADGKLSNDELNSLKDLLFNLSEIYEEDWQRLKLYMDTPVEADEAERLMNDVLTEIRSGADQDLVVRTLDALIHSDGEATTAEEAFVQEVKAAIDARKGIVGGLRGAVKRLLNRRSRVAQDAPDREEHFEDYLENEIYHGVVHMRGGNVVRLPDQQMRKLCLCSGFMAWVAHTETTIQDAERAAIAATLQSDWSITRPEAQLVTDVSCEKVLQGLDYHRLCRSYFEATEHDERGKLLRSLFQIANAAEKTQHEEIERIREISQRLKVSHQEFIDAKLTISREDRAGL